MEAVASQWMLPVVAGAAVADSLNPCAFSVLFLTVAFLFSLGKDRRFILKAGALYIAGIALVYILIGVGLLQVLSLFSVPNVLMRFGAGLLVAYGLLSIAKEIFPSFPVQLKMPESSHSLIAQTVHKASLPASFVLGLMVGLFEFPCTGGPYLFVLSLLHDQATFWSGFGYLVLYNALFVLPLAVILALSSSRAVLERVERLRRLKTRKARIALDVALIALGVVLISL